MPSGKSKINQRKISAQSYLLLRAGTGINFALHGAIRFGDQDYFIDKLAAADGRLEPGMMWLVYTLSFGLPLLEMLSGIAMTFGLATRLAIIVLGVLMAILTSATIVMEGWDTLALQLIFFAILYWLFRHIREDWISFDRILKL